MKSQLPTVKNIHWAVKAIDPEEEGSEQKLQAKVKDEYAKVIKGCDFTKIEDVSWLIK